MSIKTNRALSASSVGAYPQTARAMLGHLGDDLVASLTSAQLAAVLDALHAASSAAKAAAARDVEDQGCVWSDCRGMMLEVAA
jgi:hypothetical protein